MRKQVKRFTLVEILMVTGMICLLAALILVAYNGVYRSWASKNTIATMKAAHLALDRYMLENGSYPVQSWDTDEDGYLRFRTENADPAIIKLAKDLCQSCKPFCFTHRIGSNTMVTVYDDFGSKPSSENNFSGYQAIHYVFPYHDTNTFALMSRGMDGEWDTPDDIIYLPNGHPSNPTLKPGFYMCDVSTVNGGIPTNSNDIEPLAQ